MHFESNTQSVHHASTPSGAGAGLSAIVVAHNEAAVIERTLRSVLANPVDRPLQIIVVANGCTDATAKIARSFGPPIEVIETPIGNKIHALNLGDAAAKYFPRAYLDADIELSTNTLQSVLDLFDTDADARLAAPRPRHVYHGWNPILAGYYKLWSSLPYVRGAVMGCGFYAMDRALHDRLGRFPTITADDKFVRNLARPQERRVLENCSATVAMPATFADLLRVKTRWSYGNLELSQNHAELNANDQRPYQGAMSWLIRRPWMWVNVPAFVFVFVYARLAAGRRLRSRESTWERDGSTRPASDDDASIINSAQRPAA